MSDADSLLSALKNAKLFHSVMADHKITMRAVRVADRSQFADDI
jgi:hypothetical protein